MQLARQATVNSNRNLTIIEFVKLRIEKESKRYYEQSIMRNWQKSTFRLAT